MPEMSKKEALEFIRDFIKKGKCRWLTEGGYCSWYGINHSYGECNMDGCPVLRELEGK